MLESIKVSIAKLFFLGVRRGLEILFITIFLKSNKYFFYFYDFNIDFSIAKEKST